MSEAEAFLSDIWYLGALSKDVRPGRLVRKILFGEPIVFGRRGDGAAFALRDVCPHRGAPLSSGRIVDGGALVECPYHGWRFRTDGACALVPALHREQSLDISKITVRRYPTAEANGLIWLWRAAPGRERAEPCAPPPQTGLAPDRQPRVVVKEAARGPFDEAVIGLVDPAHTPVVHKQWWWRQGAGARNKSKSFEPTPLGFRMPPHAPSANSRIYRFLGGAPTTEIEFHLPALRFETIRTGRRNVLSFTAMTPGEPGAAEITHLIYWDAPALDLLLPFLQKMAESFLAQDARILGAQSTNLRLAPHSPLYLGDPDEPAKWYLRLKRAWLARAPGEPFVNPIEPQSLRWKT
ncbi:MAG: aromatic ring-hydroxylating dioxygenase subunit alpha [Parvularculaceae bacterium]|jgi:phenylpropionate dioxygenase-like ring-hydroxylating dioxygenase large terminal subunit|nr:aromatic ring-hydroxylating dioxygenase subunit alpha [Parvularculaceae bacterium]